ncbi:vitelline membrane outer layer protein 1 homolog [Gigantopelta aegis]|uniref:vitelline membrane outer layer protein 1 homolog n=1 Tax=Gigantopelta aegis TaxID=1735272 RepID=UPI001B88A32A|nr:vitelline membrane outer layer protein 1 homolog [Gigantopelta aegis]
MNSLVELAVILLTIGTLTTGERTALESNVNSMFGSWGDEQHCPDGSFAIGFMIKQEGPQGRGDDTATNGVRLLCDDNDHTSVTSKVGDWGNWIAAETCGNGRRLWGFKLKVEENQVFRDDTAVNGVSFICGGGEILEYPGNWGHWRDWHYCPVGHGICGIKTKVEGKKIMIFNTDNVAMSDMTVYCCPMACLRSDCGNQPPA